MVDILGTFERPGVIIENKINRERERERERENLQSHIDGGWLGTLRRFLWAVGFFLSSCEGDS
jgi:hypothetical protein